MTSAPAFFGRLTWMILGPFALALCTMGIAQRGSGWLSLLDLIYVFVACAMFVGRLTEFRYGRPLTATGEPATAVDLRRYTLVLSSLGVGLWVVAKLVANHSIRILG
jgi:hypothetical protein